MKEIFIHTDGAARGNPGPAGAGGVLKSPHGELLGKVSKYLGEATNNQAEYQALIFSLEEAKRLGAKSIKVFMDSELAVRQLNGQYKVKNEGLKPLFEKVLCLLNNFESFAISHVPREKNKDADKLANEAIDNQFGKSSLTMQVE